MCIEYPGGNRRHANYIFGFDTNSGMVEGKDQNRGDDFGISILGTDNAFSRATHVCSYRGSGFSLDKINNIIYFLNSEFKFYAGIYDPSGGGTFVKNRLKKGDWYHKGVNHREIDPIIEVMSADNLAMGRGKKVMIPFGRQSAVIKLAWGKMDSESTTPNLMHKYMRDMIAERQIRLAPKWSGWDKYVNNLNDIHEMREFMNTNPPLSYQAKVRAEADIAVRQLGLVDIKRDEAGSAKITRGGLYVFQSKQKKDAAYGLTYAGFLFQTIRRLMEKGINVDELFNSGSGRTSSSMISQDIVAMNSIEVVTHKSDMSGFTATYDK